MVFAGIRYSFWSDRTSKAAQAAFFYQMLVTISVRERPWNIEITSDLKRPSEVDGTD
jgi:hypothetical protein